MVHMHWQTQPAWLFDYIPQLDPPVQKIMRQIFGAPHFPSFAEAVEREIGELGNPDQLIEFSFVRRGLYAEQWARYTARFSSAQLYVVDSRELQTSPGPVMERIFAFLGLPPVADSAVFLKLRAANQVIRNERLPEKVRERLTAFYQPHNERLFQLIARRFDW